MDGSNMFAELPGVKKKIPLLGLGTWQAAPGKVMVAVETAIACGYRHIDTAYIYGNEKEVGQGIKAKIDDGTITRGDIFVTTKLWMTFSSPGRVEQCCRESLERLGLDYVDLYLIHFPAALVSNRELVPIDDDGFFIEDGTVDYVDTWKAMESLVDKGLVRAIGVSNFNAAQIQRILDLPPKHPISNNQVECHPLLAQNEMIDFCMKHGITVTAYSPLGSPERPSFNIEANDPVLLENPVVCAIANKRGVSPAQVLIRYQIQRGVVVVPKSVTSSRIQQNFQALNFELSEGELDELLRLNQDYRLLKFKE